MIRLASGARNGAAFAAAAAALALTAGTAQAVTPATAAQTSTPIAQVAHVSPISRLAGWTVWSAPAAHGRYALTAQNPSGQTATLPVPTRTVPFDADLGRDAGNRLVVAYSRCTSEPHGTWSGTTALPLRITGRGCDVYEYRLGAAREQRITSISSARNSEIFPSVSGTTIGFVRVAPRAAGHAYRATVDVLTGTAHRHVTTLPSGPVGADGLPGPSGLDLQGSHLAFTWASRKADFKTTGAFSNQSVLQVDRTNGSHRVIQRTTQGSESSLGLLAPSIDGNDVFFAAEGYGRPNVLARANMSTGKIQTAPAPLYVVGMSEDAGQISVNVAPGSASYAASPTCTGTHTGYGTQNEPQSTTCDIQTLQNVPFH